jgi:hypothetical protein
LQQARNDWCQLAILLRQLWHNNTTRCTHDIGTCWHSTALADLRQRGSATYGCLSLHSYCIYVLRFLAHVSAACFAAATTATSAVLWFAAVLPLLLLLHCAS